MKTYLIAVTLSLVSLVTTAGEYQTSVGVGHQYGGILGAQLSYKTGSSKYYGALGLFGFSAGFQTAFSENTKHAFGMVIGREEFQAEDGFVFATYDYHVNGFNNNGFVIGTGIGVDREDEGGWWSDTGDVETSTSITLNIGYKF